MVIAWAKLLPVVVSIVIIIAIAILREYSRAFAAIAATMPLNIPLGMWIVYAGADDKADAMNDFTRAVLINIIPTVVFMIVAYFLVRAGWELVPTIFVSYIGWAIALGGVFLVQRLLAP